MNAENLWLLFILLSAMSLSARLKKLTLTASLTGGLLGICIYIGAGFTGIAMLATFFVPGTLATSWRMKDKQRLLLSENYNGTRKASQVIANAGISAMAGLLIYFLPQYNVLLQLIMAAALASATADTLSSELGNVYGKRFYNILTFQKDKRGLDGVISLEGTLAGLAGSVLIGLVYAIGFGWKTSLFVIIVIAGTVGNLSDSLLGAAFERKKLLNNDAVNFINTLIAALAAFLFYTIVNHYPN